MANKGKSVSADNVPMMYLLQRLWDRYQTKGLLQIFMLEMHVHHDDRENEEKCLPFPMPEMFFRIPDPFVWGVRPGNPEQ